MEFFRIFSAGHLAAMGGIGAISVLLAVTARKLSSEKQRRTLDKALACAVLINALGWWGWTLTRTGFFLPLHICDVVIVAAVFTLFTHRQWIWELVYVWGLGGSLMAVLTPDLRHAFPHPMYWQFFLTHGMTVAAAVYLSAGRGRPVYHRSLWRVWLITNLYAAAAGTINVLTGSNLLYLSAKPQNPTILDFFAPWPWYILQLEVFFIIILYVLYLPYACAHRRLNT